MNQAKQPQQKKKILLAIGVILGALVLLWGALQLVTYLNEKKKNQPPEYHYEFDTVYNGNIHEYRPYLNLDRQIYYCADPAGYGLTQAVGEENRADFSAEVLFLCDWLNTIIDGDADAYNAYFNQTYFANVEPQKAFAQQMLYNLHLTYHSEEKDGNDRLVTYTVTYMIRCNNGTYRQDIGSDAARPQRVTLRVAADGTMAIERLVTIHSN